jgi:hypothetical protein
MKEEVDGVPAQNNDAEEGWYLPYNTLTNKIDKVTKYLFRSRSR